MGKSKKRVDNKRERLCMTENEKNGTDVQEDRNEEISDEMNEKINEEMREDIEAVIALLDGYTSAGDCRIKVNVIEGRNGEKGEVISRQYHHGRCDVGSPWACGAAFDVLE